MNARLAVCFYAGTIQRIGAESLFFARWRTGCLLTVVQPRQAFYEDPKITNFEKSY
ncbi:hypothetical protein V2J66_06285 [Pseudomonas alliivorans]|uniref:hypothetical protein n=1 Tax=Pseudomonas alliivorans TaxID=2810613 RepID=UPI001AE51D76|nr:hypothetical protein [Pseudomonas alliivorans]MBP0951666.1 hypothetical protein [Pseudomonas alliivorans]MEE4341220.1 hypothetical protein [Pseudomonas alliivorans]MEE4626092.1 hypothetical protein [Pseudomonas alliivorans]MEE5041279.1 hypothetical protein [Pseudomonas alliivorans]MEE5125100.1 hypothetical protein [Pseudomonas alliivorans]